MWRRLLLRHLLFYYFFICLVFVRNYYFRVWTGVFTGIETCCFPEKCWPINTKIYSIYLSIKLSIHISFPVYFTPQCPGAVSLTITTLSTVAVSLPGQWKNISSSPWQPTDSHMVAAQKIMSHWKICLIILLLYHVDSCSSAGILQGQQHKRYMATCWGEKMFRATNFGLAEVYRWEFVGFKWCCQGVFMTTILHQQFYFEFSASLVQICSTSYSS